MYQTKLVEITIAIAPPNSENNIAPSALSCGWRFSCGKCIHTAALIRNPSAKMSIVVRMDPRQSNVNAVLQGSDFNHGCILAFDPTIRYVAGVGIKKCQVTTQTSLSRASRRVAPSSYRKHTKIDIQQSWWCKDLRFSEGEIAPPKLEAAAVTAEKARENLYQPSHNHGGLKEPDGWRALPVSTEVKTEESSTGSSRCSASRDSLVVVPSTNVETKHRVIDDSARFAGITGSNLAKCSVIAKCILLTRTPEVACIRRRARRQGCGVIGGATVRLFPSDTLLLPAIIPRAFLAATRAQASAGIYICVWVCMKPFKRGFTQGGRGRPPPGVSPDHCLEFAPPEICIAALVSRNRAEQGESMVGTPTSCPKSTAARGVSTGALLEQRIEFHTIEGGERVSAVPNLSTEQRGGFVHDGKAQQAVDLAPRCDSFPVRRRYGAVLLTTWMGFGIWSENLPA
ncbi:hypothetical protein DFH09DRAFT_1085430 [Mycena vulgaris]|nr:hypothetical protein DFH09DRAFT_1085430 [Mycena vulgaris]